MSKNRKNKIAAKLISESARLFRCPLCYGRMRMADNKSLLCANGHCFDLSKHGYINLSPRAFKSQYGKRMFESRRIIAGAGFFEPLYETICQKLNSALLSQHKLVHILDAGCGEGSHLHNIRNKIIRDTDTGRLLCAGLDIAKEGIDSAARNYPNIVWCVGDITDCPFAGNGFDVILNILSPSNYSEFQRMLSDEGAVIKVIPESGYLYQLRDEFYEQTGKQAYSNSNTIERFGRSFELVDVERVRYNVVLNPDFIEPLIHMTPLSWRASEERLQKALSMSADEITVDLTVLTGKKKPVRKA